MNGYTGLMNHEILSKGEERALLRAAQNGDDDARERLVLCNMKLVSQLAHVYAKSTEGLSSDDLIADGVIGLLQAIEKHDLSTPYRFSTYAVWWIRSAIARSSFFQAHIRLPEYIREDIAKVRRAKAAFLQEFGVTPTTEHIATETNIDEARVTALEDIQRETSTVQSLYEPINADDADSAEIIDFIADDTADADFRQIEVENEVDYFLDKLNPLERRVVELRWGLTPPRYGERMSWKDIYEELYGDCRGSDIGKTRLHWNDLPQVHAQILRKLQRLAIAYKAGTSMDAVAERQVMTGVGETVTLF